MYVFSSKIEIPAGCALGGYGKINGYDGNKGGYLEAHGFGFDDVSSNSSWEVCAIDALYAGELALLKTQDSFKRIFAASHTHFAPMLDPPKKSLGLYSSEVVKLFAKSLKNTKKTKVVPDKCTVLRGEVDIPIYRRFDYPPTSFNKFLTKYAGAFPNSQHPVDKGVYIFLFSGGSPNLFCIVYHACHPVTRHDEYAVSADYIEAIRRAVFNRFGTPYCLFFLGCAGDIRPNFARKRVDWLPAGRLNWRFNYPPSEADQYRTDQQYFNSVRDSTILTAFPLNETDFTCSSKKIEFQGIDSVIIPEVHIKDRLTFSFMPFEVSHRFHLASRGGRTESLKFIVSCSNYTYGYLPYPDQLHFGGYEVDGSRRYMELDERIKLKGEL